MSEPTPETQPKLLRQTCLACRQSKVKCDRASPACGRCVRLGIACIDSAPSRRGRGRSVGKKTAALQQLSGSALDSVKSGPDHTTRDIQDTATRGGAVSIEHVREWLLVALARDSSTLFARASLMASQGKLKLSDVFAVPTANGACCAARSECCAFHERLPPGNPFSRRFAGPAPVTPQLSPEHSPPPPASVDLDPPAAKSVRAGPIPGAPARAIRTDTRADDAAAQAAEALASSFPAALPNAAKALLKGPYNEAYAWYRVVVDGAIAFGASAAFDHKICRRQQMAAHFALNTTPVPSLYHDAPGLGSHADAIGRLHSELALKSRAAPGSKHIDCTTKMGRTMLKGRTGDVPCDCEISLSVYHGGRITVIAQVYHPLSEADRPVCPATAHSKDAPLFDDDQLYSLAELL